MREYQYMSTAMHTCSHSSAFLESTVILLIYFRKIKRSLLEGKYHHRVSPEHVTSVGLDSDIDRDYIWTNNIFVIQINSAFKKNDIK